MVNDSDDEEVKVEVKAEVKAEVEEEIKASVEKSVEVEDTPVKLKKKVVKKKPVSAE